MTNDYCKNIYSTQQQFDKFKSIDVINFDKSVNINEDVNNNKIKVDKPSVSLHPTFDVNNEKHLSMDISSNEVSFRSQEWLIIDSLSKKHRAPRQNEFLLLLLENSKYSSYICWIDKSEGLFKICQPQRVATLWSKVKNRHTNGHMNYETFARGIRFYYRTGQMIKTNKKHTFCFQLPLINIS